MQNQFKTKLQFLSASFSVAGASTDHFFPFLIFFLYLDFHELWHSVMGACLYNEVKQQWVTLGTGLGDCLRLCGFAAALVD